MDKIAQSAEGDSFYRGIMNAQRNDPEPTTADAISTAARSISETLAVAAIVSYTESGSTAMRVARERAQRSHHHADPHSCDRQKAWHLPGASTAYSRQTPITSNT